jgi:flagellar protein FliS
MTANKAFQAYSQNHTAVQTPEKLIEMLYEGLLKFTSLAKRAIEEKNYEAKANWINRSTDIFVELTSSLSDDGTDMSSYLNGLYLHQIQSLSKANMQNSIEELDTIIHVVRVLLETWKEETSVSYEMA